MDQGTRVTETSGKEAGGFTVRAAALAMAHPLVVLDRGGVVVDANGAFLDLAGMTMLESQAVVPGDLFVTHASGVVEALIDVLGRPDAPRRGEACLRRQDGRVMDVSYTAAWFHDGEGMRDLLALTVADITAEKCLNCKIHISREKYRRVVDDHPEYLCRLLPDTTVTFVNDAFANRMGCLPHEIVGRRLDALLSPRAVQPLRTWMAGVGPEDFLSDGPEGIDLPGTGGRAVTWRRRAIFGPDRTLLAVQLIGRDAASETDAKAPALAEMAVQASVRLRDSEDRHRRIVSALDEGVILADRAGRVLQINKTAGRLLGIDEGKTSSLARGSMDLPIIDRDGRRVARRDLPLAVVLRTGKAVEGRILGLQRPDGAVAWMRVNAQPILLPGHDAALGLLSFSDVTDLMRTECALDESRRNMRAILDHTFEFIGLLDAAGTVLDINRSALSFVGSTIDDVRGKLFCETPWWQHDPALRDRLRAALAEAAGGEFVRFEASHVAPSGRTVWIDFSLTPVFGEDGAVVLLIPEGRDISNLKQTERRLDAARLDAEAANATKTHFLANMSHELRTPLNAILGYAEAVLSELFGPLGNDRYREYLTIIHTSGRHLQDIIADILEISRIELGELSLTHEDAPVAALIADADAMLAVRAEVAGVALVTDVAENAGQWRCDRQRVLQILLNLGSNAIKFTPRGGRVTVAVHREAATADQPETLVLCVADTGAGIAPDLQGTIWEPFRQVSVGHALTRGQDGLGLGLPIVRRLVEAHGGTVSLVSSPGEGTRVVVRLPVIS